MDEQETNDSLHLVGFSRLSVFEMEIRLCSYLNMRFAYPLITYCMISLYYTFENLKFIKFDLKVPRDLTSAHRSQIVIGEALHIFFLKQIN